MQTPTLKRARFGGLGNLAAWVRQPRSRLQSSILAIMREPGMERMLDFSKPPGDPGLLGPDAVGWRVMRNQATVFMGGITAVLLEFLEPRVRAGVWEHSSFRKNPIARLKRTGLAAMATTYGSVESAQRVGGMATVMHARVKGQTDAGRTYDALDPELQSWVFVTAGFGFLQAYRRYINPHLSRAEIDQYWAGLGKVSGVYGEFPTPRSAAEVRAYMETVRPRLENSEVPREFLEIMNDTPAYSGLTLPVQRMLISAAVDLLPAWAREMLDMERGQVIRIAQRPLVKAIVLGTDWVVRDGPAFEACRRMGIPAARLYR